MSAPQPPVGPIARRLKQLAERGQDVARDERKPTMRPGPGAAPRPERRGQ